MKKVDTSRAESRGEIPIADVHECPCRVSPFQDGMAKR